MPTILARLTLLENKFGKKTKETTVRKPSEYNNFMKKFISEQKIKFPNKQHKELFSEGAKAWSAQK
jgi:hypothetical protein